MTEKLQHHGFPAHLPESELVGDCHACGGEMYKYEVCICEICGNSVHRGCIVTCSGCGYESCKSCMKVKIDATFENGLTDKYYCHKDCEE